MKEFKIKLITDTKFNEPLYELEDAILVLSMFREIDGDAVNLAIRAYRQGKKYEFYFKGAGTISAYHNAGTRHCIHN